MSDNRQRPCILRVLPAVRARVGTYATRQGVAPNVAAEALINGAAAEIAAFDSQLVALRAELESAREATRRADAEVDRLTAEATVRAREYAAAAAKLGAETDRLTRELAHERASDEAAQETLRGDVAREIEAAKRAEGEVERLTRELAGERLKTEAAQAREQETRTEAATRPAPCACACALPDDFEAKLAERAPGWKGTLPELRARVITLGFSRYDALATDAAKRAAERGR